MPKEGLITLCLPDQGWDQDLIGMGSARALWMVGNLLRSPDGETCWKSALWMVREGKPWSGRCCPQNLMWSHVRGSGRGHPRRGASPAELHHGCTGNSSRESYWTLGSAGHPILQGQRSGEATVCRNQHWRNSALHVGESHTLQEANTRETAFCRSRTLGKVECCKKLTSKEHWNQKGKKKKKNRFCLHGPLTPPNCKA